MTMPLAIRISQYFGFICTEITTLLLLWLILKKASRRLGSYKYLMLSYTIFSMVYAWVEILTQPIMHLHGSGWIIWADSFIKNYKNISYTFVSLYCASFGLCVSLLASHFVYRFLAICRPHDLRRLDGFGLIKLYIFPIIFFTIWFLIGWFPCAPSDLMSEYMKEPVREVYDEDTFKLGHIGMLYYTSNPKLVIRWTDFVSCFTCCTIMQVCILTMISCGWKTYKKMQMVGNSMSFKTKELNNQLFRTLILQTLVPMLTMFTPVGLLLILPMFSISVGTFANAPSLNAAIFPALDASIAIFMVMHLHGACMFIYVDSFLKSHKSIALVLVGLYCATFGLCIILLATHFIYRFVAICRPQDMHHFQEANLLRIYLIPLLTSIGWYYNIVLLMGPTDVKAEYMSESIKETYDEDTSEIGYIAALYYYTDPSGALIINWTDFLSAFICCGIMQSCILTMTICGWKTYRKMQSVGRTMSKRTKELNSQLFKTLIVQTLIPMLTMFTPVGLLIILPMFSIGIGKFANAPGFYAGFYPALDALIAIFMIRDFRDTVLCKKMRKRSINDVGPGTRYSSYHSGDP